MTIRYAKLLIKRNPMESIARTVPLYEAPILEAIHGPDAITLAGEVERDIDAPNDRDEFDRLARLYGRHPDSGLSMVEYVYGRPTTGALAKAIEASVSKPAVRARKQADEAATA